MNAVQFEMEVSAAAKGEPWRIEFGRDTFAGTDQEIRVNVRVSIFKPGYHNNTLEMTDQIWQANVETPDYALLWELLLEQMTAPDQVGLGIAWNDQPVLPNYGSTVVPF